MNRSIVEEIKQRLPIEDVLGNYMKIEKSGKSLKAKCPFHNEKTPSFFISPERGGYYCFGCNAKGDIFTFVQQFEGLDFRGALKVLAERAGVPLVYDPKADSEKDRYLKAMDTACAYYESQLQSSSKALEYLKKRGLKEVTIKEFRIGFAPDGWQNIYNHLKQKGFSDGIIEKIGLIKKPDAEELSKDKGSIKSERYYDRFRGRIMFPICDSSGRVIAFSGRILEDDGKSAKYINSPDTPIYDKSMVLFGLDKAKTHIRRMGYTIFVEGQMDLIMSHQAGIKHTVAVSGTAMGDAEINKEGAVSNIGLVKRLSPNLIVAFDADLAGKKATLRACNIALSLGMDVKVASIVGGKDPADIILENPDSWKEVLKSSKHVVEFELNNVVKEIEDKRKLNKAIFDRVLPLLARVDGASNQDFFVKMISDKSGISTDALWQDLRTVRDRLAKEGGANTQGQEGNGNIKSSIYNKHNRLDIIERQVFGVLFSMEVNNVADIDKYKEELKRILDSEYEDRYSNALKEKDDLLFEVLGYFGDDVKRLSVHMKELLKNLEIDMINDQLAKYMHELKIAESKKDDGKMLELAKKCQELTVRKAKLK